MAEVKLTVHRALALKKTTEQRISEAIEPVMSGSSFIAVRQGRKTTINGVPVEKIETDIRAKYDKVLQLISNYKKLKKALLQSNAGLEGDANVRTVTVAGKPYTMAELIDASDNIYGNKKHSRAFLPVFLATLKSEYSMATRQIENAHAKVEQDIKDYLAKAAGNDKALTTDDIKKRSEMFHEDGDKHLVDPLNLKNVIEKLENEIKTFRVDCDATMSEQNALTTVSVDLTDVE
jgi:hypothetical protein